MARPKEFRREDVLDRAIEAFSDHGFAGTSTDTVLSAMGISRQSMYDTFGDKRKLYVEALRRYDVQSVTMILESLQSAPTPLGGIEAALLDFASRPAAVAALGCLGVSSTCEFGESDPEIKQTNVAAAKRLTTALERVLAEGQRIGQISKDLKVRTAAQFVLTVFTGLKVAARGGASSANLRDMARISLRALQR